MPSDVQSAPIAVSAAADNLIVAAVAGKRIQVLGFVVANAVATAQAITWKSAANALTGAMALPSSIGGSLPVDSGDRDVALFVTNPGEALNLTLSAATAVGGWVTFRYV
jgi:hypothetical protein